MAEVVNYGLSLEPTVAIEYSGYANDTASVLLLGTTGFEALVTLAGTVKAAAAGSIKQNVIFGKVPYPPQGRRIFPIHTSAGIGRVDIDENGFLIFVSNLTPSWISVDGISFHADLSRG